jgi:hypothetical protein
MDEHAQAKGVILDGIERFPEAIETYGVIAQTIIEATGDHTFRDRIKVLRSGGGKT